MIKRLYSVRDTVAEMYLDTFSSTNNQTAIRDFTAGVKESPNKDDLVLYYIGDFDNHSGWLKPCEPERLLSGLEITKSEEPQLATIEASRPNFTKKQAI